MFAIEMKVFVRDSNLGFQRVVIDWTAALVLNATENRNLFFKPTLQKSDCLVTGCKFTFVRVLQCFQLKGKMFKFEELKEI